MGCGGRDTLAALHARELVCHADVEVGRLAGNPFRAAVDAFSHGEPPPPDALANLSEGQSGTSGAYRRSWR